MKEILWLGRGGQGAFTAAKLFGAAYTANEDAHFALAFPSFGPERRGAPVRAFTKLDVKPVLDRSQTEKADFIVILDETLYAPVLQSQLKQGGRIIVNSKTPIPETFTFDGEAVAAEYKLPTVNTVMLGIVSALSGYITEEQAVSAIEGYMPQKIQARNIGAVRLAREAVQK